MNIDKICDILNGGGVVISPTDTVYGIMGDALNEDVVRKIYNIKRRPYTKPLLLLMSDLNMVFEYTNSLNSNEIKLLQSVLGVTVILKKSDKISNLITANDDYVGIRIPDNKELIEIISKLNRPVVSTSCNISDEEVITSISLLDDSLKNSVDYIYDGGDVNSLPSTIVKFDNDKLIVLRAGKNSEKIRGMFNC